MFCTNTVLSLRAILYVVCPALTSLLTTLTYIYLYCTDMALIEFRTNLSKSVIKDAVGAALRCWSYLCDGLTTLHHRGGVVVVHRVVVLHRDAQWC